MKNNIDRSILSLTLPAVASNITVPLLGLCDTAISGHLGNESFLAAIATGSMMFNVIFLLCGFLRMATTGLTAEAFGRKSSKDVSTILLRSGYLSVIIGILVILFKVPLLHVLESIIDPQGASRELASEYFSICIWGTPAFLLTMAINGWFVGMQNTVYTMIISITINIVNIIGSLIFVFCTGLEFRGVALGTLCANWFGVLLSLFLLSRFLRKKSIKVKLSVNPFAGDGLTKFFNISGDLFFRSFFILSVTLTITSVSARIGEITLAINTVMMQFFLFFSYFMDGLAYSAEALCGKWSGAGDKKMLTSTIFHLFKWTTYVAIAFTIVYIIGCKYFAAFITDVEIVRKGVEIMKWFVILIPLFSAWAFILDGIFIGLAGTRRMLITVFIATSIFGIIVFSGKVEDTSYSNYFLWTGFLSYLLIRGIGLIIQLPVLLKRKIS